MYALVTGGGGFLGRYIVEQLVARGDCVRSLGRGAYPKLEELGVEVVRGDICDLKTVYKACEGVDCVFHVAAVAGISMRRRPYVETNIRGTETVLEGCLQNGVQRLVYTSSPSVVFDGTDQQGIDATFAYNLDWLEKNNCHYSKSKALAELLVISGSKSIDTQTGASAGLRCCALRPHLIWGPRDQHLIPRLISRARSGRLRRVGDGTNLVDMIYVENAAQAHLQVADALAEEDSPVAGNVYFLSQGEPVNCWQWIDEILALAELPPVEKSISYQAAWRLGAALEKVYSWLRIESEPPMTRFLAAQLARSHWYDISAARRDFGYEPAISTAEGMRRLGEWLRESA